jgi:hypothetical protein
VDLNGVITGGTNRITEFDLATIDLFAKRRAYRAGNFRRGNRAVEPSLLADTCLDLDPQSIDAFAEVTKLFFLALNFRCCALIRCSACLIRPGVPISASPCGIK